MNAGLNPVYGWYIIHRDVKWVVTEGAIFWGNEGGSYDNGLVECVTAIIATGATSVGSFALRRCVRTSAYFPSINTYIPAFL